MFAVEFHYFHDDTTHPRCQGSLSAADLERMLDHLQARYTLLNAADFLETALAGTGRPDQICLTFDDGVRSQLDVAVPVLEARGLTGMFFCYSSHFCQDISMLEVYHDFRFRCYETVEQFYADFFACLKNDPAVYNERIARGMEAFSYDEYLPHCPWHSYTDKLFRYTRDCLLTPQQYRLLMAQLMLRRGYDWKKRSADLWIDAQALRALEKKGHLIGLHSHTHPTNITALSREAQWLEYAENQRQLSQILNHPVTVAAYPCGKYHEGTLADMARLKVNLAFTAEMTDYADPLRMPRKNHPLVWAEMLSDS